MRTFDKSMFIAGAVLALATGCATPGGYSATVSSGYRANYYGPDLVTVQPGVQVIANYDEPIFYTDNFYWRYDGGSWYRSPQYTGGWSFATPPPALLRIDRPYAYRHYRPNGWAPQPQVVGPPPTYYQGRGYGYDQQQFRGGVAPAPTYAPPPQTRPSYGAPMRPQYQSPARPQGVSPASPVRVPPMVAPPPPSLPGRQRP